MQCLSQKFVCSGGYVKDDLNIGELWLTVVAPQCLLRTVEIRANDSIFGRRERWCNQKLLVLKGDTVRLSRDYMGDTSPNVVSRFGTWKFQVLGVDWLSDWIFAAHGWMWR